MAEKAPISYKDPFWANLSASTESRLGLPEGLLNSIVMFGERSNADQVSSAGAKTPYQITPTTRQLVMDKYGIDAYLSPENAAEAAGLLLKESLERNQGNAAEAVSEYHGGTDRSNWGPITRAYTRRVIGNMPQSTFSRVMQAQEQPQEASIAAVYDAYRSGQMTEEESAQFEADVRGGLMMLPQGASLSGERPVEPAGTQIPEAITLPQEIADAYVEGQLSEQERADLEADIREGIVKLPAPSRVAPVETETGAFVLPTEQGIIETPREPTLGERLRGAGETALALGTGATGGAVGMIGGTAKGLGQAIMEGSFGTQEAADMVERAAMEGASALTYMPSSDMGQRYTQDIGRILSATAPLAGLPGEVAQLTAGIRAAQPAIRAAAEPAISAAQRGVRAAGRAAAGATQAVRQAPARAMEAAGLRAAPDEAVSTAAPSAGAAGVEPATIRATKAESLPVPVRLTKGAETREAGQLAFEKEQMKGELGAPLRKRAEENNLQIMQNFESLLDESGADAPDMSATGNKVIDALSSGYKSARTQTNAAYAKAKASAESKAPVNPATKVFIGEGENALETSVIDYLNSKIQGVPSSAVTDAARKIAIKIGIATEDDAGNLVARPATVAKMEEFRRELSGTAKWDDKTGIRDETIIKKIVDAQTEPVAGPLFKEARRLRADQARKYENRAIVARLITNRKGMDDPQVAVDQVFNRSVLSGSPEEITFLKRVLNTSGADGRQAWKEIQAATLRHIRDEATKGMGMDSADNPIVSPAKLHQVVTTLDKNNRLDIVLGKKQAQIVRDLNDVARYVNTVPPGTLINNSGTVGTLLAAIGEAGATGALTGLPVPAITILKALGRNIQNKKLKLKINAALNAKPKM